MYSVSIYKKNVERIDFPSNSEIHGKIKDIKIEKVGNLERNTLILKMSL